MEAWRYQWEAGAMGFVSVFQSCFSNAMLALEKVSTLVLEEEEVGRLVPDRADRPS
jgi:hypothetical protein